MSFIPYMLLGLGTGRAWALPEIRCTAGQCSYPLLIAQYLEFKKRELICKIRCHKHRIQIHECHWQYGARDFRDCLDVFLCNANMQASNFDRYKDVNMKKIALAGILLSALAAPAFASDFYAVGSIGGSHFDV
ncbi:MAG TPA: hypothetical protein VF928_07345, partial [Usitatibacteraceae bacterium]